MARMCGTKVINYTWEGGQSASDAFGLCVDPQGSSVRVDLTVDPSSYRTYDWVMYLQRYYTHPGAHWATIGTRTGFVSRSSPSPRTFTNIRQMNAELRVVVNIINPYRANHVAGTLTSEKWRW